MDLDGGADAINALRERCRQAGRELLTPKAATVLFGVSDAAVRIARLRGHVATQLSIAASDREVQLLHLESALRYWRPPRGMQKTLAEMRRNGTMVSVGHEFYNILHTEKVLKANTPATPGRPARKR